MANAALAMPQRVEDATVRMMTSEKVAKETELGLIDAIAVYTWNEGPYNVGMILNSYFSVGSDLVDSAHECWHRLMKQTSQGQNLAVDVYRGVYNKDQRRYGEEDWGKLLIACGIWAKIASDLLPAMLFNPEIIETLSTEFCNKSDFRTDIANLAVKEPPASASASGDIAAWLVSVVSRLRRAKQDYETNLRAAGDSLPASKLAQVEAQELLHANYLSGVALDVNMYRKATEKLEEEKETLEKQWRTMKDQHMQDVKRFQKSMQQSECSLWRPIKRQGLKNNNQWVAPAAEEAMAHRNRLKTIVGCTDEDILQINVFPLYTLGTLKKCVKADQGDVAFYERFDFGVLPSACQEHPPENSQHYRTHRSSLWRWRGR